MPADYVRALEELQQANYRVGNRHLATAIAFARKALPVLVGFDREVAALEHSAPPAEVARLNARVSTLRQTTPPPAHVAQHQALIAIVESEIALLQDLQQRKMLTHKESIALFDVIKSLWTELRPAIESSDAGTNTETCVPHLMQRGNELLARHDL